VDLKKMAIDILYVSNKKDTKFDIIFLKATHKKR